MQSREDMARLFLRLRAQGLQDRRLFIALEHIPRYLFLQPQWADIACDPGMFPIECGQFIESLDEQIFLIDSLAVSKGHRLLEIGTGSGFATAILATLAGKVTSIERFKGLVDNARQRFQALQLPNIVLRHGDAATDLQDAGPFDRIIIWGCIRDNMPFFTDLLANNGILIAAFGEPLAAQTAIRYQKKDDLCTTEDLCWVRYSPLLHGVAKTL